MQIIKSISNGKVLEKLNRDHVRDIPGARQKELPAVSKAFCHHAGLYKDHRCDFQHVQDEN